MLLSQIKVQVGGPELGEQVDIGRTMFSYLVTLLSSTGRFLHVTYDGCSGPSAMSVF